MFDYYKHLDGDIAPAPFDIDKIAKWAANQNYGAHRMVCALTKAIEERFDGPTDLSMALRSVAERFTT